MTQLTKEQKQKIIQDQVDLADEVFSQKLASSSVAGLEFGRWTIAYQVLPLPRPISHEELLSVLQSAESKAGWRIGVVMPHSDRAPQSGPEMLWAWLPPTRTLLGYDKSLDYWMAKTTGFFYHTRVSPEDSLDESKKRVLLWYEPIWVVGEGILHATHFARGFNTQVDTIRFFARYQGLQGRVLSDRVPSKTRREYTCHVDEWSNEIEVSADTQAVHLPNDVPDLLDELYHRFVDAGSKPFWLPADAYSAQLLNMLKETTKNCWRDDSSAAG